MPVVLVEVGGVARSGHEYLDRTSVEYEYPAGRYERMIQTGEQFVYQVPRVGYTGCGVIGAIRVSKTPGRLVCEVLSVRLFEHPVALKSPSGSYYEADSAHWRDKVYWGQGVRPLSEERFEAIIASGGYLIAPVTAVYANHPTIRAVEDYSVAVAQAAMYERFRETLQVMPHNNPGFDIRVGPASFPTRYVEVKGTSALQPTFFMSDGERNFSLRHAPRYTLVVVSGIDVTALSHVQVTIRDGAVDGRAFDLHPTQWRGQLLLPTGSDERLDATT
jgi:hypothetical protein